MSCGVTLCYVSFGINVDIVEITLSCKGLWSIMNIQVQVAVFLVKDKNI
jgi:hypothetical protein